jgi:excisionase family DNA binding protein
LWTVGAMVQVVRGLGGNEIRYGGPTFSERRANWHSLKGRPVKSMTPSDLISPIEAALLLSVDPKTVSRWASAGKINSVRTPGGHRRFVRSEILALGTVAVVDLSEGPAAAVDDPAAPSSFAATEQDRRRREDRLESDRGAAVTIADAVRVAAAAEAEQVSADVIGAAAAVDAAATMAAAAARRAREIRMLAVEEAAEAVADDAARAAGQVKLRADSSALQLSQAAHDAAALVITAHQLGYEREDAARALQLALNVKQAAVAAAQDSADAAARVASAVAAAAAAVAFRASAVDAAIESEVAKTAAALQVMASALARQEAVGTDERASARATIAREAARAVRRRGIDRDRRGPRSPILPARIPQLAAVGRPRP